MTSRMNTICEYTDWNECCCSCSGKGLLWRRRIGWHRIIVRFLMVVPMNYYRGSTINMYRVVICNLRCVVNLWKIYLQPSRSFMIRIQYLHIRVVLVFALLKNWTTQNHIDYRYSTNKQRGDKSLVVDIVRVDDCSNNSNIQYIHIYNIFIF